jgi:cell division septal protein FtsQ
MSYILLKMMEMRMKEIEANKVSFWLLLIFLLQVLKLHMVLFKLEMIQVNNKLFFTENKIIQINYLKYYMNLFDVNKDI